MEAIPCHGRRSIHSLHWTDGAFVVFNEVFPIWSNGESTTGVNNDVDEGFSQMTGDESGDDVRIEVGSQKVGIEGLRKMLITREES